MEVEGPFRTLVHMYVTRWPELWPDRIQWLPLAVALLVIGKVSSEHLEHKVR